MRDILDFEQFASAHGCSRADLGEAGLHKTHSRFSKKQWDKMVAAQSAKDANWLKRRDELRKEYDNLLAEGLLRTSTRRERLETTANGHPDREDTQAARRLLVKHFGISADSWLEKDNANER